MNDVPKKSIFKDDLNHSTHTPHPEQSICLPVEENPTTETAPSSQIQFTPFAQRFDQCLIFSESCTAALVPSCKHPDAGIPPTTNLKNRTKPDIVTPPPSKIPRKVCAGLNKSPVGEKLCYRSNFKQVAHQQDKLRPAVGYKMMEVWVKIKRDSPSPLPPVWTLQRVQKLASFSEKRSIDIQTPESLRESALKGVGPTVALQLAS